MVGLYEIVNIYNGKRYVGSSCNILKRFNAHKYNLRKGTHANSKLQNAWDKHGEKYFIFNLLVELEKCQLESEEQKLLDIVFKEKDMCYNIATDSKAPTRGRKASKEEKDFLVQIRSTKEWKENQSAALKKYFLNPESRIKSSDAWKLMSKNNSDYKNNHREALLLANKKPEVIEKRRLASTGKVQSEESKKRSSESLKNKFADTEFKQHFLDSFTEEVKQGMSISAKKRWADADNKAEQAARTTSWFSNPDNRLKNSEATKAFFANPKNREAARLRQPSKLSESDIEYIREQGKIYGMQIKLCKRFELSPTHISNIVNNKVFNYQA